MCNSTGVTKLCHQGRRTVPAVSGLDLPFGADIGEATACILPAEATACILPAVATWRDEGEGRSR
jgi:hypothetical protein